MPNTSMCVLRDGTLTSTHIHHNSKLTNKLTKFGLLKPSECHYLSNLLHLSCWGYLSPVSLCVYVCTCVCVHVCVCVCMPSQVVHV